MQNIVLIRTLDQVATNCSYSANECLRYRHALEFVEMAHVVINLSRATAYILTSDFARIEPLIRYMISVLQDLIVEVKKAQLPKCRIAEASCVQCIEACHDYLNERKNLKLMGS